MTAADRGRRRQEKEGRRGMLAIIRRTERKDQGRRGGRRSSSTFYRKKGIGAPAGEKKKKKLCFENPFAAGPSRCRAGEKTERRELLSSLVKEEMLFQPSQRTGFLIADVRRGAGDLKGQRREGVSQRKLL